MDGDIACESNRVWSRISLFFMCACRIVGIEGASRFSTAKRMHPLTGGITASWLEYSYSRRHQEVSPEVRQAGFDGRERSPDHTRLLGFCCFSFRLGLRLVLRATSRELRATAWRESCEYGGVAVESIGCRY
jgi:hypothetical protein